MKGGRLTGDAVYRELVCKHLKPPTAPFAAVGEILAACEEDGADPLANRTGQAAKTPPPTASSARCTYGWMTARASS